MNDVNTEIEKLRIDKDEKSRPFRPPSRVWLVLVLVLLIGGTAAFQWHSHASRPLVQTLRVSLPDPKAAPPEEVALNATGYIVAAHKIELASKVVGRVAWVGVEMGDKIRKGQVLVRLEDDEYKARVTQQQGQLDAARAKLAELEAGSRPEEIATAQAAWDKAQAEYTVAEINAKRMAQMQATKAVSRQQVEDAEALMQSRLAQLDSEKQQLQLAKIGPRKEQIDAQRGVVKQLEGGLALAMVDLDNTVIRSQISATVLERNVEVGEFVTTGFVGDRGAKGYVLSIADLSDLRVELDVSQNDIAKVSVHQPCWITTDAYPDKRYAGVVDLISPEANRQKATVQVRVKVIVVDDLLKPEMNATVSFLRARSTTQPGDTPPIHVPSNAVRDGAVFVLENGKARKRRVTTGWTTSTGDIEITQGLSVGEDVVLSPPESLNDGDLVTIKN
jgi:HlyD family secretion protein